MYVFHAFHEKLHGSVKTGERPAHRLQGRVVRAKSNAKRARLVGKKYLERCYVMR